jgi:ribosome-associated protein
LLNLKKDKKLSKVKAEVKKKVASKGLVKPKAEGTKVKAKAKVVAKTAKATKAKASVKVKAGSAKFEVLEKEPRTKISKKTSEEKKKNTELNRLIVHGMQEKKALDITILDLTNIKNCVADYFILCSASSDTQVGAISDSIEEEIHKAIKQNPWRKEGQENKEWILLDYVDVVAHVFKKDRRQFYSLEELWGDATITRVE